MDYRIDYKVNNIMEVPELCGVSLDYEIGARFDTFIYERVSGPFAIDFILREAEEFFAEKYEFVQRRI